MPENAAISLPMTKTSTVYIDDKMFNVISVFKGTESASRLIYDLAVKRILYENNPPEK